MWKLFGFEAINTNFKLCCVTKYKVESKILDNEFAHLDAYSSSSDVLHFCSRHQESCIIKFEFEKDLLIFRWRFEASSASVLHVYLRKQNT
jgi:hypothetical protein